MSLNISSESNSSSPTKSVESDGSEIIIRKKRVRRFIDEDVPLIKGVENVAEAKPISFEKYVNEILTFINPLNASTTTQQFTEIINVTAIDKLLSQFKPSIKPNDLKILAHLKKNARPVPRIGRTLAVTYTLPKKVSNHSECAMVGRLSADRGLGMQALSRECRSFVAHENYIDLDIENCQVVLCREVFRLFGCKYAKLDEIIVRREEIFAFIRDSEECENIRDEVSLETREDIKAFILSLLFDYERKSRSKKLKALASIKSTFDFQAFANEMEENTMLVCEHPKLIQLSAHLDSVRTKTFENSLGTVFSYFLQQLELCCTISTREFLKTKGRISGTHIHDGFFVEKINKGVKPETLSQSLLDDCAAHVLERFGLNISYVCKPMKSIFFDVDGKYTNEDGEFGGEASKDKLFVAQCKEFEQNWFFVNLSNTYYSFITHSRTIRCCDDNFKRVELYKQLITVDSIDNIMKNTKYGIISGSRFDVAQWQKTGNKANEADEIIMDPSLPVGFIKGEGELKGHNRLNIFQGFAYPKTDVDFNEETDGSIIKPMMDLLRDLLGGDGDVEVNLEYYLNYFASILQKPDVKLNVCMIMLGAFGDGKDMSTDEGVGSIIGGSYVTSNKPGDDFLGRFNGLLSARVLVKGEELAFSDMKESVERFKSYVTAPTITIENKGQNIRVEDSFHNFMFTTNNDVPCFIPQGDRRFVMFKSRGNTHKGDDGDDHGFWARTRNYFSTREFKEAFARLLWNKQIPAGWNAKDARPKTECYASVIQSAAPAHTKFMNFFLSQEDKMFAALATEGGKWDAEKQILKLRASKFLDMYNAHVKEDRQKKDMIYLNRTLKGFYEMPDAEVKLADRKSGIHAVCHFKVEKRSFLQIDMEELVSLLKRKGVFCDLN